MLGREDLAQGDDAHELYERQGDRHREQIADGREGRQGYAGTREPGRHDAHYVDTLRVESKEPDGECAQGHGDERSGCDRYEAPQHHEQYYSQRSDGEGDQVDVTDLRDGASDEIEDEG